MKFLKHLHYSLRNSTADLAVKFPSTLSLEQARQFVPEGLRLYVIEGKYRYDCSGSEPISYIYGPYRLVRKFYQLHPPFMT